MIFTYNKEHVGDVLMVIVKNSGDAKLDMERKGKVARVFLKDNGETVAWNIFEVSSLFEIAERGQIFLLMSKSLVESRIAGGRFCRRNYQ